MSRELSRNANVCQGRQEDRSLGNFFIRPARTEDYLEIRQFLLESEFLYPGIELWWDYRVLPNLEHGQRIVLVVDSGQSLQGLFIGKPGHSAKVCTLRLREPIRNQGIGRALVTEGISRLIQPATSRFHVTISEGAEEGCIPFFESLGFRRTAVENSRYKTDLDEFIYSCSQVEVSEVINNYLSAGIDRYLYGASPKPMAHEQTLLMSLALNMQNRFLQVGKQLNSAEDFQKHMKARQ